MENARYMISDAANIVNVESHVLRYWEEELELAIPRNEMGHRYYTEENIAQFQKIKEWKEQGYQLKAIRMMIHSGQPAAGTGEFYGGQPAAGTGEFYGSQPAAGTGEFYGSQPAGELQPGGNNVIQMNREYVEPVPKPMVEKHNNPISNTVKLEQFQSMMLTIVKQAMEENNPALGKEVGAQVGDRVLKEMNYLMREQDEAEEERFRRLDEAIRATRKSKRFHKKEKKETEKRLGKEKKLSPNLTVTE
ncbi:MAG: MerR family transcriptional regulator [Lachnospiraceae bacterium]|nr:MerR family transcriptional regulator [Lachnospiraceae bacterium]